MSPTRSAAERLALDALEHAAHRRLGVLARAPAVLEQEGEDFGVHLCGWLSAGLRPKRVAVDDNAIVDGNSTVTGNGLVVFWNEFGTVGDEPGVTDQ